jgi:hypothetical protein
MTSPIGLRSSRRVQPAAALHPTSYATFCAHPPSFINNGGWYNDLAARRGIEGAWDLSPNITARPSIPGPTTEHHAVAGGLALGQVIQIMFDIQRMVVGIVRHRRLSRCRIIAAWIHVRIRNAVLGKAMHLDRSKGMEAPC